jgi:hypothetical protein
MYLYMNAGSKSELVARFHTREGETCPYFHINVRDSGWRLTVQEVLRICCVALWHC